MQASIKKNAVYNAIKTLSSILFPLITFPYISRVLLAENVGKINFALSIVSYFSLIATLGTTTYAIRECSAVRKNRENLENTASQIYSINIITTVAAYVFLAVTLLFCRKLANYKLLIIIQSFSIGAATIGADWLNSAIEDFRFITFRTVAFQIISLIFMLTFVHKPSDYMIYAVISQVASAGASITNVYYRRKYCRIGFIWDIRNGIEWKKHMMPIMYLFVMILAQTIFNSVDSTMLGLIHGDREVGLYSTAYKIQNLITQVIVSSAWVVMPRMSSYFAVSDFEKVNELARRVFGCFCLAGLPCVTGVALLSKEIILISAGSEFVDSASVLQILIIGFVFSLFGGSFWGNIILLPAKQEKKFMVICSITAVINVVANYFLIPDMGAKGAAVTTCLCNVVMMILLIVAVGKKLKVKNVWPLLKTPIIGCFFISVICYAVRPVNSLWLRTAIAISASILTYCLIQLIGKNELFMETVYKRMKKVKHKI